MRILKLLVLGAMVLALSPVLALAETPPGCGGVGLDETLLPSGNYFHIGEQICYEAWLAINAPKCDMEDVEVFHAGTAGRDGKIVTNGGRVLGVTALGDDIPAAQARAYEAVKKIHFEGAQYRTDIAAKAVSRG